MFILNSVLPALLISLMPPKAGRDCRGDVYFVDVPVWAAPPSMTPSTFITQLGAHLEANVPVSWFCGSDGPSCTNPSGATFMRATVTAVLSPRTPAGQAWRNDGDKRFYRVTFSRNNDRYRTPLWARPSRTCEVIRQLRLSTNAVAPGATMWVGRDCEASGHGVPVEAAPSNEQLDWVWDRLGAGSSGQGGGNVDIVLIDSGVDPLASAPLDIAQSRTFGTASNNYHPHGSGMAALIRAVTERSAIHDFRVLSANGHSTSAPLGQAIDAALFEVKTPARPMVINLSLGWPRVHSEYVPITLSACSSWEDPAGELIRYLIHGSGLSNLATIVASAGNDPTSGHPYSGSDHPPLGQPTPPTCAALSQQRPWFYPAQWDATPSCFAAGQQTSSPIAVSGTNDRDQKSAVGVPGGETPLVAPADHVYAEIPGVPSSSAVNCPAAIGVRAVQSPQVFSGSSVAAALVSAAVARAHDLYLGTGALQLSTAQVEKLLYLTGQSLCRATDDNIPVRRLSLNRLERAFAVTGCVPDLLACSSAGIEVDASTLSNCAAVLQSCGLEPSNTCPLDLRGISWSAVPASSCDGNYSINPPLQACTPALCPDISAPNRVLIGGTGPQPNTGGCPDCLFARGNTAWTLYAELGSGFPIGTSFADPYVEVIGSNDAVSIVKLVPMTPASSWVPGAKLKVIIPLSTLNPVGTVKQIRARLVMTMQQGTTTATDYSALRVGSEP